MKASSHGGFVSVFVNVKRLAGTIKDEWVEAAAIEHQLKIWCNFRGERGACEIIKSNRFVFIGDKAHYQYEIVWYGEFKPEAMLFKLTYSGRHPLA